MPAKKVGPVEVYEADKGDEKPRDVAPGSRLRERDSGYEYIFENGEWVQVIISRVEVRDRRDEGPVDE